MGTGYTGTRVLRSLPTDRSYGLSRCAQLMDTGHEVAAIDFDRDISNQPRLPNDYSLLYTVPPPATKHDSRLERLVALLNPAPARIVYISTSGVYGDRAGQLIDETTPVNPHTDRAWRRVNAERLLQKWCAQHHCELSVLRTPAIYGPARLGIERLHRGDAVLVESDTHPGNRIHVDDLVNCCIAALHRDVGAGIYNIGDGDFRSASWFAKAVARHAGIPEPPEISREAAEKTFPEVRMSFLSESRRLDNTKMREILRVEPRDPEKGIRDSL